MFSIFCFSSHIVNQFSFNYFRHFPFLLRFRELLLWQKLAKKTSDWLQFTPHSHVSSLYLKTFVFHQSMENGAFSFFLRTRRENCTQIVLIMWKKIAFSLEFEFIKLVREQVKIYILLAWLAVLSFARRINIFQQITVLWATRLMSNWHANACGSPTPKTLRRSNALLSAQQKLSLAENFGGGGGRALI